MVIREKRGYIGYLNESGIRYVVTKSGTRFLYDLHFKGRNPEMIDRGVTRRYTSFQNLTLDVKCVLALDDRNPRVFIKNTYCNSYRRYKKGLGWA